MKSKILLPLLIFFLAALSYICAPLAVEILAHILEPDYITPRGTCSRGYPFNDSPTEREMRKAG